jgi:hypothetical protein
MLLLENTFTLQIFQISAFNNKDQIICIYYFVHTQEPINLKTSNKPFDFTAEQSADKTACAESFRFIEWENLSENSVLLPIDKVVVKQLLEKWLVLNFEW